MGKKKTHRSCTKEFKLDVVQQSYLQDNISELASELGLSPAMIYKWKSAYDVDSPDPFPGKGVERLMPEEAELQRIKAESTELRLERDILKRPLASSPMGMGNLWIYARLRSPVPHNADV